MQRREFLTALAASSLLRPGHWLAADSNDDWMAELAKHKLRQIHVKQLQLDWPRQVGKNARLGVHGTGSRPNACILTTDQGAQGWGALRGKTEDLKPIGRSLANRPLSELFDPAKGILDPKHAPLDFALHDLAGVILNVPVYKMLGAKGKKTNDCYSGMIYFDDLEPEDHPAGIDAVLKNCQADIDRGYRQLKVKIGRGNKWMPKEAGIARDVEVTKQIAQHFPDIRILVDGNNGFTLDEITRYLEGIGDVELFWIEEPFHETVDDYVQLRERLAKMNRKTYLADGEASPDWKVLDALFDKSVLDVQLVDIVGYGFTPWRELLPKLIQAGHLASPHAWGHALKTNYVAHLAAGYGGVLTIEGVTCSSKDVDLGDYPLKDGKLTVSDAPGFGMKLL